MTEETPSTATADMHTVVCPSCADTVPAGVYCGACGYHLALHKDGAKTGFRSHSYAAAPAEHVLRLSVVSSLFPHLPHRSRAPFRIAVVVLAVALVVLAAVRLQAPMIAVAALGVPLLFQLYLQESDVYEDLPVRLLAITALLGVAHRHRLGAADRPPHQHGHQHAIDRRHRGQRTVAGRDPAADRRRAAPARPHLRRLRDQAAASLTSRWTASSSAPSARSASPPPRRSPGSGRSWKPASSPATARSRASSSRRCCRAAAVPITAASVGGVVGAALWVRRRTQVHFGRVLASAKIMVPAALLIYLVLGPHRLLAATAGDPAGAARSGRGTRPGRVALRAACRAAARRARGHHRRRRSVCPHCEQVVPAMPFCPHCGYAHRAASRSARTRRISARRARHDPAADPASAADGPGRPPARPAGRRTARCPCAARGMGLRLRSRLRTGHRRTGAPAGASTPRTPS